MPRVSEKTKLIKFLIDNFMADYTVFGEWSTDEECNELLDNFWEDMTVAMSMRYAKCFKLGSVPKSRAFFCNILPTYDEDRFRQIVRVSWYNFHHIVEMIKDDEVFNGPNSWKQFPVELQLTIVLYRLGCSGEGASIGKVAKFFGVGDGGTIAKITKRVFVAICKLQHKYIQWPDYNERKAIIARTFNELPYCIGYVDGTEIRLAEKPTIDPEVYFSRKCQYALKMQIVCDFDMIIIIIICLIIIRHAVIGYPGSVHDSRMYSRCTLATNAAEYFSESEWILGDSAYKLTTTVLTPYRSNATHGSMKDRNSFNKYLSKYRVRVENCFAFLKERFSSLKELKLVIGSENNNRFAIQWVMVCCILNNIIRSNKAVLDEFMPPDNLEEPNENPLYDDDEKFITTRDAELKRKSILELIKNNL